MEINNSASSRNVIVMRIAALVILCMSLAAVSIILSAGCGEKPVVVNAPSGVNANAVASWYQATGAMVQISDIAAQGPKIISSLYQSGAIDDEYRRGALTLMKQFDQAGLHAIAVLKAAPNNFTASVKSQVESDTQSMLTELQAFNLQGGTHVKNPAAMAAFNDLISSAKIALGLVQSL